MAGELRLVLGCLGHLRPLLRAEWAAIARLPRRLPPIPSSGRGEMDSTSAPGAIRRAYGLQGLSTRGFPNAEALDQAAGRRWPCPPSGPGSSRQPEPRAAGGRDGPEQTGRKPRRNASPGHRSQSPCHCRDAVALFRRCSGSDQLALKALLPGCDLAHGAEWRTSIWAWPPGLQMAERPAVLMAASSPGHCWNPGSWPD